ncbi:MAG: mitochondrial fission ELM1 family protein [Candidatus Omnitrophica bacterium]|nr:mitochondrial fission ELM1 family protein [Candidatus Omnitrophota bacterium]
MKTNSFGDSTLYFLARGLSALLCLLPLSLCLWIGRRVGDIAFLFYRKRGEIAYANLKSCLGGKYFPSQLLRLERKVFQNLMQTAVEVLRFPKVNEGYLSRYVTFHGMDRLAKAKERGKGTIALTAHFGNWELQSVGAAIRGYPEQVLARQQKFPKTNALLNRYRELTGCKVIHKGLMIREIIRALRENGLVGILTDQDAGRNGVFVNFFGRPTSFAPGAIAFALKTGCEVIPCFARRERHAHHVIEITEPLNITKSGNEEEDLKQGLQQFAERLENFIRKYPDQWLWLHKRWKSSPTRHVAILNDGKAGHLNQSLGVASSLQHVLQEKGLHVVHEEPIGIRYKNKWRRMFLAALSLQANRSCQGCLKCVRFALTKDSYEKVIRSHHDFVISTGSSVAPLNRILSYDHPARSIVVMDPVFPPASSFDLAVIPHHDKPPLSSQIVATRGAPHALTEEKIRQEASRLAQRIGGPLTRCLGLLIGGSTEEFPFRQEEFTLMIETVTQEAKKRNLELLVSSSRRTSKEIEEMLEKSWKNDPHCKLLVLANRMNFDGVVPGILGLSNVVIVTGESISMVSEAASAADRLIVFLPSGRKKGSKIEQTLSQLAKEHQAILTEGENLGGAIQKAFEAKGPRSRLDDAKRIEEALRRIV